MPEQTRTLIFIWTYPNWGGSQMYFLSIIKEARKLYEVVVFLSENSDKRVFDTLDLLQIKYERLGRRWKYDQSAGIFSKIVMHIGKIREESVSVRRIAKHLTGGENIVQTDMGFWESLLPLWRLSLRTNLLMTVHTALPDLSNWRKHWWRLKGRMIAGSPRFFIQTSNIEARSSLYIYLPAGKVDGVPVAYSGFDGDEINAISDGDISGIRAKYGIDHKVFTVCCVGQFIDRKGRKPVLEALKLLKEREIRVSFIWLGTTPATGSDRELVESYELGTSFRLFSGSEINTRHDLLSLVGTSDIFVLASLNEGLPIALLEAMALGKPCIATRVNAIPEAIENGSNGILVEPGNSAELADAISALANDRSKRDNLGKAAKRTAFEKFDQRISSEIVIQLYNRIFTKNEPTIL